MTIYEITAPDGRQLEIEGDTPPSERDLDEIFSNLPPLQGDNNKPIYPQNGMIKSGISNFDYNNVEEAIKQDPGKATRDMLNDARKRDPITQALKGGLQGLSKLGVGLGKNVINPLRSKFGKQPLTDDELDKAYGFLDDEPEGLGKISSFIGETAPYLALPEVNLLKDTGFGAELGNSILTNTYQGGLIGGLESLRNEGNISGTGIGAGLGATVGTAFPIIGAGVSKLLPRIGSSLAGVSTDTINQAIKPNSKALDLNPDQAQALLYDTTQNVRNAYNNLLSKRGQAVGEAAKKLNDSGQRILLDDLKDDVTNIFNKYDGDKINPARNMTGTLEQDLKNLVDSSAGDKLSTEFTNSGNQWINDKGITYNQLGNDEISAQRFLHSLRNAKQSRGALGEQVYEYPTNEYQNMKLFLSPDNKSGVAIKPDGDIVSVFSHAQSPAGTGGTLVELAKSAGGKKLDAFDTFLPDFYKKHGFKTYATDKWNEVYKPTNWNKDFFKQYNQGEPDIKYMALDEITASPNDVNKIKQQVGHMVNWSDETARNYKNPILEQFYGNLQNRLSDLSPELASANQAYAKLRGFQKNEGLRRVLRPGDNIDSASSALKNYNSTVTKGNTGRNIQDLENILVANGEQPFLNIIDDINAAMDLNKSIGTGRNFGGVTDAVKALLVEPTLRGARAFNRTGIPQQINYLRENVPLSTIQKLYGASRLFTD